MLLYVDKWSTAKKLLFKEPILGNLDAVLFDFLVTSTVSKYTFNQMNTLTTEYDQNKEDWSSKDELKERLAEYFNLIKQNIYKLVEENLKNIFVKVFNQESIPSEVSNSVNIMMRLLNIIPKDLRIYIREGVIFNKLKIVKSLWRKSCKEAPNYSNYLVKSSKTELEKYSKTFVHLPVLLSVISKHIQDDELPMTDDKALNCFEKLLGKGPALVLISAIETIFQCQLSNDFLAQHQGSDSSSPSRSKSYNFIINTEDIDESTEVDDVIHLRSELKDQDSTRIIRQTKDEEELDKIKELYVRQLTRVIRMIYFMVLKSKEQLLYQLLNQQNIDDVEVLEELRIKLFCVTMRLTGFDDMDNYNNTMKSACNMLSNILLSNKNLNDNKVYHRLLQTVKNYYRSDMIHRRSKNNISALVSIINSSNLPDSVKREFTSVFESNLCGTLDNIDAILRFKFLLKDPDFVSYLLRFKKELQRHSSGSSSPIRVQQLQAMRSVTELKLHFLKLWSDLHNSLSVSFDYSFAFQKGNQWVRIDNVFNLSNEILSRVDTTKKSRKISQRREIEIDSSEFIPSDILPQPNTKEMQKIKKTVNIEFKGTQKDLVVWGFILLIPNVNSFNLVVLCA